MSASTCVPRLLAILCGCLLMACTGGNSIEPAGVKPAGEPSTAEVWHTAGHIGGPVRSVAVAGGYAYVAHSGELAVVDLADPHAPRRVGYVLLPANHVMVSGPTPTWPAGMVCASSMSRRRPPRARLASSPFPPPCSMWP